MRERGLDLDGVGVSGRAGWKVRGREGRSPCDEVAPPTRSVGASRKRDGASPRALCPTKVW